MTSPVTESRTRRLVKYVKNEPGHRVTVYLNLLFVVGSFLFGFFILVLAIHGPAIPKTDDEYYNFHDQIGMFCFCCWNSLFMNCLIIFPSILTVNRERNLAFFALNGLSVFFTRLSDFYRAYSRFQIFTAIFASFISYLLYMAIFNVLYAMPDDLHLITRTNSMRPWIPIYEDNLEGNADDEIVVGV